MKLPSIKILLEKAGSALFRFGGSIISSLVFAFTAIMMIERDQDFESFGQLNLLLVSVIGISLFFLAQIIHETYYKGAKKRKLLYGSALLLLILIYFSLPGNKSQFTHNFPYIRCLIYFVTTHLIIAVLPFISGKKFNGLWNYNKYLFIRIIVTHLFSTVLATGLLLALAAIKMLFDVQFDDKIFPEIYVAVFSLFNTWFFVANIPSDLQALDNQTDYPSGLKVFSQYILLPLLLIYLLILYAYGGKILISWEWPKGIVSYLVLCISLLGGLTFLLLYPYANTSENQWIKNSTKAYYMLLLPLLFLLFFAIFLRLDDYGITLNRYVILMFGVWVSMVSIYTIMGKTNIKFIPLSLTIILLLSAFGPWSMDNVPKNAQKKRLETLLTKAGIMKNGKVVHEMQWQKESIPFFEREMDLSNDKKLNDSLHNEIVSIVEYLNLYHNCDVLNDWFSQDMDSLMEKGQKEKWFDYRYSRSDFFLNTIGLSTISRSEIATKNKKLRFSTKTDREKSFKVTGYDYFYLINEYSLTGMDDEKRKSLLFGNEGLKDSTGTDLLVVQHPKPLLVLIYRNKEFLLNMTSYVRKWELKNKDNYLFDAKELSMEIDNADCKLLIQFYELALRETEKGLVLERVEGVAYLDEK